MNRDYTPQPADANKSVTNIIYALYAIGLFTGVATLVAVIVNYVKRGDVAGTPYASHFTWQLRTFWYSVLWGVVGWLTVWIIIGFLIWAAAGIWYIYRIVKGWLWLNEGKGMYVDSL